MQNDDDTRENIQLPFVLTNMNQENEEKSIVRIYILHQGHVEVWGHLCSHEQNTT